MLIQEVVVLKAGKVIYIGFASRPTLIDVVKELFAAMGVSDFEFVRTGVSVAPDLREFVMSSVRVRKTDTVDSVVGKVSLTRDFWEMSRPDPPRSPPVMNVPPQAGSVYPVDTRCATKPLHLADKIAQPIDTKDEPQAYGQFLSRYCTPDAKSNGANSTHAVLFHSTFFVTLVLDFRTAEEVIDFMGPDGDFQIVSTLYVADELADDFKSLFHSKPVPSKDYASRRVDAFKTLHGMDNECDYSARRMACQIVDTRFRHAAEGQLPCNLLESAVMLGGEWDLEDDARSTLPAYFSEMGLKKVGDSFIGLRYVRDEDILPYVLDPARQEILTATRSSP